MKLEARCRTYLGSGEADEEVACCTGDVMGCTAAAVVVEAVGDCMGGSTVICNNFNVCVKIFRKI